MNRATETTYVLTTTTGGLLPQHGTREGCEGTALMWASSIDGGGGYLAICVASPEQIAEVAEYEADPQAYVAARQAA